MSQGPRKAMSTSLRRTVFRFTSLWLIFKRKGDLLLRHRTSLIFSLHGISDIASWKLTYWCQVMPDGIKESKSTLSQVWLVIWWLQFITWTNVDINVNPKNTFQVIFSMSTLDSNLRNWSWNFVFKNGCQLYQWVISYRHTFSSILVKANDALSSITPQGTHLPWTKWPPFCRQHFEMPFLWMKSFVLLFHFHWSLFPRFQLTIIQHWIRKWLDAV